MGVGNDHRKEKKFSGSWVDGELLGNVDVSQYSADSLMWKFTSNNWESFNGHGTLFDYSSSSSPTPRECEWNALPVDCRTTGTFDIINNYGSSSSGVIPEDQR